MNYLELAVKLRERVASQGAGPTTTAGQTGIMLRIVNWINEAYAEIQRKWTDWKFRWFEGRITTAIGTNTYAMPSDIGGWFKDCFYYDGCRLPVMSWAEYRLERDSWDTANPGEPQILVIKPDGSLLILPTPDDVYSIRFEGYRSIQVLSQNDDLPILPTDFHMLIVYKAMEYYGFHQGAEETVAESRALYAPMLQVLEASQLNGQEYRAQAVGNDLVVSG